ncbi:hypothetical protein Rsub_10978 [Raphidocelis subcapitata]|uniref:Uncharacterized protein n=1 Tax=Raphidocelis subcapitata TaxID=307507 RepID=A0A2V0PML8_9CHLO|nr:hypothetical protein Rsub_10978 [Raphidocelis subcapitata]|eukprot:GBF98315.1 hypothetical protein Rsub_10978 [Raphidocelis subcapitata]
MWDDGTLHIMARHAMLADDASWLKQGVAECFLLFCKLARAADALPPGWDWRAFLAAAAPLLDVPLPKEDAKELWDGENFFAGMLGGRSLRFTATVIYGFDFVAAGHPPSAEADARPEFRPLRKRIFLRLPKLLAAANAASAPAAPPARRTGGGAAGGADARVFDDVGGGEAWARLLEEMDDPAETLGLV